MKRFFWAIIGAISVFGCVSKSDFDNTNAQIEELKANQIASISEQLSSIKNSINELKDLYSVLPGEDEVLYSKIVELEQYVNEQLPQLRNWSEATFSTLKQYESTCEELARIKNSILDLVQSVQDLINAKISTLETSMQDWVNNKLTGYWTIAQTQAKLDVLADNDAENLAAIRAELKTAKDNLTLAYQQEITEAIEKSEGRLSSRINDINNDLLDKIGVIESRLAAIESRLDELEKEFSIDFIDADGLACMPGKSLVVNYFLTNVKGTCQIECIGENGWSGSATQDSATKGHITVTAPDSSIDGKVLVLARSANKIAMKSLYFETGILNVTEAFYVGWQGEDITVPVEYNIDYSIDVGNASWFSFVEEPSTKADTKTKKYLLSVQMNPEDSPSRSAEIKFHNSLDQIVRVITVYQSLSPTSSPISFQDEYTKLVCVNKYDRNGDGELSFYEAGLVTSLDANFFGEYKTAITSFNELQYFVSLTEINDNAFYNVPRMKSVTLPNGIKSIGNEAFQDCFQIEHIDLPESLETIKNGAFYYCVSLEDVKFPSSLKSIGARAFEDCHSFKRIVLNEGLEAIGARAFAACQSVEYVYVPSTLSSIRACFNGTTGKAEIHGVIPAGDINTGVYRDSYFSEIVIGDDVKSIGDYAFYHNHNTTKVTIGKNVESIGYSSFILYNAKPVYYFRRFLPVLSYPRDYSKFYVPRGSKELYMVAAGWPGSEDAYEEYDVQ